MNKARGFLYGLFMLLNIGAFCQQKHYLKGQPRNLDETFLYLNQLFNDTDKYNFMTLPVEVSTVRLHHGLGMWMRNTWGLWGNSELKKFFTKNGVEHPDDMSSIILTSYHQYLNNKPIDFESESVSTSYNAIVQSDTANNNNSTPELLSYIDSIQHLLLTYFPVGDTFLVPVYATQKKMFTKYASSVEATAIVKEHRKDKVLIEIIGIRGEAKKKPAKQVGDIYEENPIYFNLLPPKEWTFKRE